ncbi:Ppx/GppA family phosphatase [Stella sp.]|uniref:Ppx/GppA phosphatase family protein n=1 Tax=Stella sp. TaxID=2912054 RepID=UPI0035B0451F
MSDPTASPAAGPRDRRVGVIDVGSNSIRLVVFDGLRRSPLALFNEKVLCGLGRGLEKTRRLHPEGTVQGLENLRRFVRLAHLMGVGQLDVLATAAVREATDGPDFVAAVEQQCGVRVRVITGQEEAALSAAGVLSGIPDAEGVMGDLGGGSVELVPLAGGVAGPGVSLPLGPLRLADIAADSPKKARDLVDTALAGVGWLAGQRGRNLYLVGGAWRALARIHMDRAGYPLHVIHHYAIERPAMDVFLRDLAKLGRKSLEKLTGVSRRRLDAVPNAALLLGRLVEALMPPRIVFSATGLREGHVFAGLDPAERAADPLLSACRSIAARGRRFGADGDHLVAWTDPLFADDPPALRRLRHAAALLSDSAWNEHPDYRAEQAFLGALRLPHGGIDHRGRLLLATMLHARYGGDADAAVVAPYGRLASAGERLWAEAVGLALRVGYTVSGGSPEALQRTRLETGAGGGIRLVLAREDEVMAGEAVRRRLDALGRALGRPAAVGFREAAAAG